MKYVRQTAGHIWADYKTNTEFAKKKYIYIYNRGFIQNARIY
jgi:hypothetical protein